MDNTKKLDSTGQPGNDRNIFRNQAHKPKNKYLRVLAATDECACRICLSRNARVYRADEIHFPWHEGCRCVLCGVAQDAVEEKDAFVRDLLLDGERWRAEYSDGVKVLARASQISITQAEMVLKESLGLVSESEVRALGINAKPAREVAPLYL
jgi:hypothetical protein